MKKNIAFAFVCGAIVGVLSVSCQSAGSSGKQVSQDSGTAPSPNQAPALATGDNSGVGAVKATAPAAPFSLDLAKTLAAGQYAWKYVDNGDNDYYQLTGVVYAANAKYYEWATLDMMTRAPKQNGAYIESLNIFVPAAYVSGIDSNGSLIINAKSNLNGFTAKTAPIVYENNQAGYMTGLASDIKTMFGDNKAYLQNGFVYVNVGSRGRDTGNSPASIVDLKAGIRFLRANAALLPGNTDKMVSIGTSGGGEMSSLVGATGNVSDYYPYLYEIGAAGIAKNGNSYSSTVRDDVYGAQLYCPIADLENADMAYAWIRYDSSVDGQGPMGYQFTAYQKGLENNLSLAFVDYLNGLKLADSNGNPLTLSTRRSGTYYDAVLNEISKALNAFVKAKAWKQINTAGFNEKPNYPYANLGEAEWLKAMYGDTSSWLKKNGDGTYQVTDISAFFTGTALTRNKDIPGFDNLKQSQEGNAFSVDPAYHAHFSESIYGVMAKNDAALSKLDGYDPAYLSGYQESTNAEIKKEVYLYSAMQILADKTKKPDVAKFWRMRNGTADQHTSFSVNYNIGLMLKKYVPGVRVDYALVWNMPHGAQEGTTTGTFVSWVNSICK